MAVRSTRVPRLEGVRCLALRRQEFVYRGAVADTANLVFLQVSPDRWFRFYIDAGSFSLDETDRIREVPSEGDSRYPIVDVTAAYGVAGRRIERAELSGEGTMCSRLTLDFEGAVRVALINEDDASRLELVAAAAV